MRAVFLDRDGVINRYPGDKNYVTKWKDFYFLPRAKEAIARLSKSKYKIFIASNQAGVGKGLFARKTLQLITRNMLQQISSRGGRIDRVYYCTHPPETGCPCRKPKAGMLHAAKKKYRLDLKNSYFIGDTIRDVHTARDAGCKSILIFSGKEKLKNRKHWEIEPDLCFKDLFAAAEFILSRSKSQVRTAFGVLRSARRPA